MKAMISPTIRPITPVIVREPRLKGCLHQIRSSQPALYQNSFASDATASANPDTSPGSAVFIREKTSRRNPTDLTRHPL